MFANRDNSEGLALLRGVLPGSYVDFLNTRVNELFVALDSARVCPQDTKLSDLLPAGERFVPTASSVTVLAAITEAQLQDLFLRLGAGVYAWIHQALATPPACDLDQAWVRRQYAPGRYPRLHAPHGWHQDGALAFDFTTQADRFRDSGAVLPMVTCWIALSACGVGAPGLEFVVERLDRLLQPAELNDPFLRGFFSTSEFWSPSLQPGDVLLFCGDLLHRTHVEPGMNQDRTSIELRFFPADALPERLKGDRFVPVLPAETPF